MSRKSWLYNFFCQVHIYLFPLCKVWQEIFFLNLLITSNWQWIWFTIATFFNKCPNPFLRWGWGRGDLRILTNSAGIHPELSSEKAEGQKIWRDQSSFNRIYILRENGLFQKSRGLLYPLTPGFRRPWAWPRGQCSLRWQEWILSRMNECSQHFVSPDCFIVFDHCPLLSWNSISA